jgi:hypothetical protein|tara:strand:- start:58 stop:201 length:144 start_codon:yes stop_codon:yes gene_type:complete
LSVVETSHVKDVAKPRILTALIQSTEEYAAVAIKITSKKRKYAKDVE